MKLGSILGILMLATAIVYGEWKKRQREASQNSERGNYRCGGSAWDHSSLSAPFAWSYPVCEAYIWKCG